MIKSFITRISGQAQKAEREQAEQARTAEVLRLRMERMMTQSGARRQAA